MFAEPRPEYDELHRTATRLADAGDLDAAISALRAAVAMPGPPEDIGRAVRLPLFLQRAGRLSEALVEFDRLIRETPARVAHFIPSPGERAGSEHADFAVIYDKMRLAFKREKRMNEASRCEALATHHHDENQRMLKESLSRATTARGARR